MGSFKRTKHACYFAYLAMSSIFSLPPLLFVIFHETYDVSYTLLGTLVLINFCTQLTIDLIFSFFSHRFNIRKTIRIMPLLTSIGLVVYALIPTLAPQWAYGGLVVGTVIFSVSAGLSEVLLSPVVAALPSDHPERDMSLLHSLYAWGVVTVVVLSSLFLHVFGKANWMFLTLFWALPPLVSCVYFCLSPFPNVDVSHAPSGSSIKHHSGMMLCVACIFLGSAAENVMTNWISSYMENALHISKTIGDVLGMTSFALLLGFGRTLYARYGKNIFRVLMLGMAGAALCYMVAGLSSSMLLALGACILMGLCTSMLWPGTLILMEEHFPHPGVTAYALMAAGGDFGGSVAPQLLGIVVDTVSASSWASTLANSFSLTPEQIGMKAGMLIAGLFPILGVALLLYMKRFFGRHKAIQEDSHVVV